jgi:hypothetical protein
MSNRWLALAFLLSPSLLDAAPAPWRPDLYLGNGGLWRQRIAVEVRNDQLGPVAGEPVTIRVGPGDGEADLAGTPADAVRVCDAQGREMLFAIVGPAGQEIRRGPILSGSTLTIPVECVAGATAVYHVYYDNPEAWAVPDFLEGSRDLRNGGLEDGAGDVPSGWQHDENDDRHRTAWVDESPHAGKKCLRTTVAEGAEPTWIATRQRGIRVVAGAKYEMRAWVKSRDVKGMAGWYVHVGNESNSMMIAPMLDGGGGTYDWKEVRAEFTAPAGATEASLGTVLRGTGVAWFDDVALVCVTPAAVRLTAKAAKPERLSIREAGADAPWWEGAPQERGRWVWRVPVRVVNLSDEPVEGCLLSADLGPALVRLRLKPDRVTLRVVGDGTALPHYRMQELLLFEGRVEPRTARTFFLYVSEGGADAAAPAPVNLPVEYAPNPALPGGENLKARSMAVSEYAALLASPRNLAKNPSFELGDRKPEAWAGADAGKTMGVDPDGLFGRRCVRMTVPIEKQKDWTGWRQDVPVRPGRSYLYAAWLKCRDLAGGGLQLHAHIRTPKGEIVKENGFTGVGPALAGTRDWTLLADVIPVPADAGIFQVHLTMQASGTAWHDGVVVAEVASADVGPAQAKAAPGGAGVSVWPVNAVVKVFREDLPPAAIPPAAIACARNEKEPLQLAVRSDRAVPGVKVDVVTPKNPAGRALDGVEVGVVGFVPVDHPSNYFNSKSPAWHRKIPAGRGGCDGWAGWWPDPLLPESAFDLKPRATQPVWITVSVPKDAVAGEYAGRVRLTAAGAALAEVPFTVRVRDFVLPDETHLKAVYDCRQHGAAWAVPGKTPQESRQAFWAFMAERRVCPDTIHPEPKLEYKDGRVIADFTEFDRAAEHFFNVLKFPHAYTPGPFYQFGWGHLPGEKFGQQPYEGVFPFEKADRSVLRPEYRKAFQACLRAYWDHVKAKGWEKKITYYISDEPYDNDPKICAQMKALCAMVHEVDPAIRIYSSTWHHQPEWDGSLDVWGIGHYGLVPVAKMEELKKRGATIWWTTDGMMCLDTPYCAIERLLPHYAFKYGAEAYEFWGLDWLTYDPYELGWHKFLPHDFGPGQEKVAVRYPNGDGYLVYPPRPSRPDRPVPSIRLEQAREGMEDYEYLHLLRTLVERRKAAGKDARAGEKALEEASGLVTSPCEIGRYSTRILPDPDRVFAIREAVARAIEEMGKP